LFSQLYIMVQHRMITPEFFATVLEPRAAALWLKVVAPLDRVVRERSAQEGDTVFAPGEHPVEMFYAKYAESGGVMLLVPAQKAETVEGRSEGAQTH